MNYFNPYSQTTFWGFFGQLFVRIGGYLTGAYGWSDLATDEIQILVLVGVAASSALLGAFLILRRQTMLANALSHTILIGIVFVYIATHNGFLSHDTGGPFGFEWMLVAAVIMGVITTFLTEFLTRTLKLQEDASIGIVFTSLFAVGIILVTVLTRNAHVGAEVVMGNVDALHIDSIIGVYLILGINVILMMLFFKEFKITTFDPGLAQALGVSTVFFHYLLMIQVSATVIGAFRAVGVIMVMAFLTAPVLTARLLTHDLKKLIFLAIGVGCGGSVVGVALSRHILTVYGIALSTAGVVVCTLAGLYFITIAFKALQVRKVARVA